MYTFRHCCDRRRCWILGGAAFVWIVMFPEDLSMLLAPLQQLLQGTTNAVSPWFYGFAAVALICWTYRSVHHPSRTSEQSEAGRAGGEVLE